MSRLIRKRSRDEGNALLMAVMVTAVCLGLTLVGVQQAVSSSRSSGVDRQRVLAVNAAEAGVDSGYTAIQMAGLSLPCTLSSGNVRSAPDTASYSTVVTYYNAAGVALACPLAGAVPAQALIRSTATTNTLGGAGSKPTRVMEALVALTAQGGTGLNKAIFANGVLSSSGPVAVTGNAGANADVYSNSNISCGGATNVAGSVHSQGSFTTSASCVFSSDLWAAGSVSTSGFGQATVAGYVKAGSGTISLGASSAISGNLYAGSTITHPGCSTPGKCFPNSSPGGPPVIPFPIIRSDNATIASWTAPSPGPGYTLYDDNTSCGTITTRIRTTYATRGTPTLLRTTCAINFSGATSITLSNDLAIFAKAGLAVTGSTSIGSSSAATRNLHLIVPYDSATPPCSSPTLSTSSLFSVASAVWMFAYSPCDMSLATAGSVNGQVYGGSKITNTSSLSMKYQAVPTYGIDPTSIAATSYTTSVVYKRESR